MTEAEMQDYTAEIFEACTGSAFRATDSAHVLTLTSVTRTGEAASLPRAPFVLIFQGPPGNVLAEGTYRFTINDGRDFVFHVMPIHTPSRDRQDYQAVFN